MSRSGSVPARDGISDRNIADRARRARRLRRRDGVVGLLAVAVTTAACGLRVPYIDPGLVTAPPTDRVSYRVILIGDAGEPKTPEPVLAAARAWAERQFGRTTIVYLGDNAYPRGMVESRRADAERKLARQIDDVAGVEASVLFVPGNHDWDQSDAEGLAAIRRQSEFVTSRGAAFLPKAGCPGPEYSDLPPAPAAAVLRLVALDTQWWLHRHARREDCEHTTPEAVVAALQDALDTPLPVVIAAHHPLATNGQHGGFHEWRDHLFPLHELFSWGKYVPLPILGSLYPAVSTMAPSRQDIDSKENRAMRLALERALAAATSPALKVFAAGHEHSLQILRNVGVDFALVSGAGSSAHQTAVARRYNTLFAASRAGFMVLDVTDAGVRLTVVDVTAPPDATPPQFLLARGRP